MRSERRFAYEETPQYDEATTHVNPEPMHVVDHSKATVLYRNGSEVVEAKAPPRGKEDRYLITYGTFGPLLGAIKDAIAAPGGLIWIRWEQRVGGRLQSFAIRFPRRNRNPPMLRRVAAFQMATVRVGSKSGPAITARSRSIRRAERSCA